MERRGGQSHNTTSLKADSEVSNGQNPALPDLEVPVWDSIGFLLNPDIGCSRHLHFSSAFKTKGIQ
ncbi:hypothetical protein E2C01_069166 [Portunus trituberculatus]|uniref:Uncharacterized protein n=1 Tax=Portunus trituberculatus TaxID=210409 RepID=A0A5B7HQQ6_PORTR|nr:hypothetical protein [Portunus trituberculatus]